MVTGLSGAGKNSAARALEAVGWYVVDNLPPALILPMARLGAGGDLRRLAAVVDVRSRAFSSDLQDAIRALGGEALAAGGVRGRRRRGVVRRYESVPARAPLQGDGPLTDGIEAERELLDGRPRGRPRVDTSHLNEHQLRARSRSLRR